jgi:hypothetical protein
VLPARSSTPPTVGLTGGRLSCAVAGGTLSVTKSVNGANRIRMTSFDAFFHEAWIKRAGRTVPSMKGEDTVGTKG